MKKTIKTFTSLLLVLVIACSFVAMSAEAKASESDNYSFKDNSNFLQFFRPIEDGLMVFCATMDNFPDVSAFNAMIAGQPAEIIGMESAKDEPVTYYCLIDVSGSINSTQLNMAKEMLRALCESLDRDDKMLIDTFAEKHSRTEYMLDRNQIYREIDQIITTTEDTNLYRGITESLEELNTNLDLVGQRKCLVVFSDGIDDITADAGRTKQEAENKIDDTRIPVYCMLPPYGAQDDGKILGSFSRRSVGGESYYMANSDLTEKQIGKAIAADMKGDKILKLDLTGFRPKDDQFLLAVQYTNKFGSVYGDTLTIISEVLNLKTVVSVSPTVAPIVAASPIVREEDNSSLWIKIGLGAVCVIAAALIAWLILKKKKEEKRQKQEEEAERQRREADARMNRIAGAGAGAAAAPFAGAQNNWATEPVRTPGSRDAGKDGRRIRFVVVGNQSFTKDIYVQEGKQTTVGRNKKADVILNESDSRLSGVHFILLLKDNRLSVRDAGSTNGTVVNGVTVRDNPVIIRSGETISAGSYQYRVQY